MDIKILHANANILMANGLTSLLSRGGGVEKVELCTNEKELYEKLETAHYDLVIIDPLATGFFSNETAIELKKRYPQQKIIIISGVLMLVVIGIYFGRHWLRDQ